ncbi:hypothetical protein Rs2_35497 [Raphanus sativus]|nr:hypothetical protein Rs2_35497 [Raphanus sativus]
MKRKRAAKKKSSEVEKKKRSGTAEKRRRDSNVDIGSSPSQTKRARNTASPPEHHGEHSPTPSAGNCLLRSIAMVHQAKRFRVSHRDHLFRHLMRRRIHYNLQFQTLPERALYIV